MTNTARLLEARLSTGSVVSGESMASELGVSRTAIFKHVDRLRSQGYSIASLPGQGYRLEPRHDGLLPMEVRSRLKTRVFGGTVETLQSAESTQTVLRGRAEGGAAEGHVVIALEQKSGKGRGGRPWHSPRGGLWFSLLLRPTIPMRELYMLTLLFGVAVARSLRGLGLEASLKWPNDVLVGEKKICGILLETSGEPDKADFVIVGIGINANFSVGSLPEETRSDSASLLEALGEKVDRAALIASVLGESECLYSEASSAGFGRIIEEWKGKSSTIGREVEVTSLGRAIRGMASDIGPDGSLIVQTGGGVERVYSGTLAHSKRKKA